MEFMQGGDLYVTMQQRPEKQFTEAEARFIAAELCLALCHLHSLDIAFRDL
jgi:serine/threonine protein kinase